MVGKTLQVAVPEHRIRVGFWAIFGYFRPFAHLMPFGHILGFAAISGHFRLLILGHFRPKYLLTSINPEVMVC